MEVGAFELSRNEARAFIEALKKAKGGGQKIEPDIMAIRLKDHLELYQQKHKFEIGQLVTLKPSLVAASCLKDDQIAIVADVLQSPIFASASTPTNEQGSWLDIRLLWVCPEHGEVHFGCFESALFEPWPTTGNQSTQP